MGEFFWSQLIMDIRDLLIVVTVFFPFPLLPVYSCLLVVRWHCSSKSRSQQETEAVYSSTLWMMCAVLISVIFCSSVADGWPGSNWRFLSNPFLIVRNAPIITGTIFVLTFHILLSSFSRSLYLHSFSVSCMFESSGMAIMMSRQVSFLSCSTMSSRFASIVRSVITGTCHVIMVPMTLMARSSYMIIVLVSNP